MAVTVGSLFSGIGGFDLGLERAGFTIEWQVEFNDYCREVLKKHWPKVPCHYDITTIDWHYIPRVDLVCGGFPCQPFSCAGKRRGTEDDRYLWPEVVRCLSVIKPTWFLGENVPGLLHLGFEQVCLDLEALGYETTTLVIPACAVDAPHRRDRLWIMADSESEQIKREGSRGFQPELAQCGEVLANTRHSISDSSRHGEDVRWTDPSPSGGECVIVADSISEQPDRRSDRVERGQRSAVEAACNGRQRRRLEDVRWSVEPNVGRVADGVPARVDRLKGLGNAVVPQVVEAIGRMILDVSRGM